MSTPRTSPRISINQLAAYLTATPSQRRRILQVAKNPPTFRVNWYDPARSAIAVFVRGGMANENILTDESARLYSLPVSSDYDETRNRTNAEAIDAFLDCYDQIDTADSILEAPTSSTLQTIHNVDISIRPEFLISGRARGVDVCGGVKLYLSTSEPLTNQSAPYIAAALMQHIQSHHQPTGHVARHALCQVIDVCARTVHSAPRATTRRFTDIAAACQEIALIWPSV